MNKPENNNEDSHEETAVNGRRDFLKKAGKFAVYTPPAMMLMMKPSYATFNKSMVGRPYKKKAGKKKYASKKKYAARKKYAAKHHKYKHNNR